LFVSSVIKFEYFFEGVWLYNFPNNTDESVTLKVHTMRNHIVALSVFIAGFILIMASAATSAQASGDLQDDQVAHGKYIATIAGCVACHTPLKEEYQNLQSLSLEQIQTLAFNDLEASDQTKLLAGGRLFDLGPAGLLFTRNITPDEETGIGAWTEDQIKLAIKTGISDDGKMLFPVMPYHVYNGMADADVEALIAYLRTVKAVNNPVPEKTVSTEGLPTLPFQTGIVAPNASDKAARGAYLVNHVMGCTDCHTPVDPATGAPQMDKYLAGRQPYEGPWGIVYGGNITPHEETGIGSWAEEEIKRAIVAGIGKDGRRLILMPWYTYAALTPEDADAVVYFLKHELQPVNNRVPAASLNPGFTVMASEAQAPVSSERRALSPTMLVVIALGIVLLVSLTAYFFRRKSASS
jgi:mono/diheme cytochrome c family protein